MSFEYYQFQTTILFNNPKRKLVFFAYTLILLYKSVLNKYFIFCGLYDLFLIKLQLFCNFWTNYKKYIFL